MEGTISYRTKVKDVVTGYTGEITAVGYYFDRKPRTFLVEGIDNTGRPLNGGQRNTVLNQLREVNFPLFY